MRERDLRKQIHRFGNLIVRGHQCPFTPRRGNEIKKPIVIALVDLSGRRDKLLRSRRS